MSSSTYMGLEVCLGRLPEKKHPNTLRLGKYLTLDKLPTAPERVMWGTKVPDYPMDDNDKLGNCTCAAMAHMVQTWTEQTDKYVVPSVADVDLMYWKTGDPPAKTGTVGGPTDTGRYCTGILSYMQTTGLNGDKILGWAQVNLRNHAERDSAHWLFGGLYLGIALPLTAQTQTTWSVVTGGGQNAEPGSWGGHCVPTVGRWPNMWEVVTWGQRLKMSEAFMQTYVDEAYVCVTQDWVNAQQNSPVPGVNFTLLQADLNKVN